MLLIPTISIITIELSLNKCSRTVTKHNPHTFKTLMRWELFHFVRNKRLRMLRQLFRLSDFKINGLWILYLYAYMYAYVCVYVQSSVKSPQNLVTSEVFSSNCCIPSFTRKLFTIKTNAAFLISKILFLLALSYVFNI